MASRQYKRADLFLVRVWTHDTGEGDNEGDGRYKVECQGKVQRVVDGESHQFDNLQALADTLLAMLSPAKGNGRADNRKKE